MSRHISASLPLSAWAGVGLAISLLVISAVTSGASAPPTSHPRLTWTQLTPSLSPGARAWTSMAYDPAGGYIVLYGGYNSSGARYYNDTWTFSNGTWTQLVSKQAPQSQAGLVLTYDPALKGIVTFGGQYYDNQTWLFRGGN